YNQQDLIPDYWDLKGAWTWSTDRPRSGRYCLKLGPKATASQKFIRAETQEGGGAWGGSLVKAIPMSPEDRAAFAQPWRVSAWCRGGGTIVVFCGGKPVKASAKPSKDWQLVTVELPAASVGAPDASAVVVLQGPGEFDDVVIQEKLSPAPNLLFT